MVNAATGGDGNEKPAHRPMIVTSWAAGRENTWYKMFWLTIPTTRVAPISVNR